MWEDCGVVSDCEELVGLLTGDDGVLVRLIKKLSKHNQNCPSTKDECQCL